MEMKRKLQLKRVMRKVESISFFVNETTLGLLVRYTNGDIETIQGINRFVLYTTEQKVQFYKTDDGFVSNETEKTILFTKSGERYSTYWNNTSFGTKIERMFIDINICEYAFL